MNSYEPPWCTRQYLCRSGRLKTWCSRTQDRHTCNCPPRSHTCRYKDGRCSECTRQYLRRCAHPPAGGIPVCSNTGTSHKCWHTPDCTGWPGTHSHLHSSCHRQISGNLKYTSIHRTPGCSRRSGHTADPSSANTRLHPHTSS